MGGRKIKRNFIVAHSLEAKAINQFYSLSKNSFHVGFDLFENDSTRLIVSGQGKVNCASAVSYIAGLSVQSDHQQLWINIGIAGHRTSPIGSLFRINKVMDELSGKNQFPVNLVSNSKIPGVAVESVEKPEHHYQDDCLYDMEASAFFHAAIRFASIEYVNGFKIVSDNLENPLDNFKPKQAVNLIESQISIIDEYLNQLEKNITNNTNKIIQDIELKEKIYNKYYLTHSQKEQIKSLLNALSVHNVQLDKKLVEFEKPAEIIESLNKSLAQTRLAV